jgi:hypothetical protein
MSDLTEVAVRNAKPKDKPYKLTDGEHIVPLSRQAIALFRELQP